MGVMPSSPKVKEKEKRLDKNLRFYRNEIRSSEWLGHTIEEMLAWKGKFSLLENKHDYIQWLFPIPHSRGMNSSAQPLTEEEAKAIRDDDVTRRRVLEAYKMMLDFYGMHLESENYGRVVRMGGNDDRYGNLNRSFHNVRRITRILISLGELGYERFQVPWIEFLIDEVFVFKKLPNLGGKCVSHWINAIKDDSERKQMFENFRNELPGRIRKYGVDTTDNGTSVDPPIYSGNETHREVNDAGFQNSQSGVIGPAESVGIDDPSKPNSSNMSAMAEDFDPPVGQKRVESIPLKELKCMQSPNNGDGTSHGKNTDVNKSTEDDEINAPVSADFVSDVCSDNFNRGNDVEEPTVKDEVVRSVGEGDDEMIDSQQQVDKTDCVSDVSGNDQKLSSSESTTNAECSVDDSHHGSQSGSESDVSSSNCASEERGYLSNVNPVYANNVPPFQDMTITRL